ncbi:MAG: hypothetical protein ABJA98_19205 [Acidobacteriota bacterium]
MKAKRTRRPVSVSPWKPISAREWAATLEAARLIASTRLANVGLDGSADDNNIATDILESPMGARLVPRLADEQVDVDAAIDALAIGPITDPAATFFNYGSAVAEAAFLLGLIAGTMTTWPVIQAITPPLVPRTRAPR